MQIFTWPKPPIHSYNEPPLIPNEFNSFGTKYIVKNGLPVPESSNKALIDKVEIQSLLAESYCLFYSLIDSPYDSKKTIEEIKNIHIEINRILNNGKNEEAEFELKKVNNEYTEKKNKLIEEIKTIIGRK